LFTTTPSAVDVYFIATDNTLLTKDTTPSFIVFDSIVFSDSIPFTAMPLFAHHHAPNATPNPYIFIKEKYATRNIGKARDLLK